VTNNTYFLIIKKVVGGWEEKKLILTTSLCEDLEESEVGQFGGFSPLAKFPEFSAYKFSWIFCIKLRRFSYILP